MIFNQLRAYVRLLIFVSTISIGMSVILIASLLGGKNLQRSMNIRRRWIKFISPVLGLKIINQTTPPAEGGLLYISNHRSFMDPVVILHFIYALPLAKAEVNSYPLIGFGARITGVLYVVRDNMNSRVRARDAISHTLREKWNVLVYPEGTTFNTPKSGPFKKGSFEIASSENIWVVPVAIEYRDPRDHWKNKSLFQQYLYQFGKSQSVCRIEFAEPITDDDPLKLLKTTQSWINEQLELFRTDFDSQDTGGNI